MMYWIIRSLIVLLAAWGGIVVLAFIFQRSMLYFPDNTVFAPEMTPAPEMQVVRYRTDDGVELASWYAPAPPDRPTIVLFHGNGGNAAYRAGKARALIDAGFGVLLAEYRGYGGNGGSPNEDGLKADGRAALDFVRGEGVTDDQLVIFGESLGTGVAVAMAFDQSLAALILEAGYSSMQDVVASHYSFLPTSILVRDRFSSIDKIDQIHTSLLMVHGTNDQIIAPSIGQRLFTAASEPKEMHLIKGAGHNDVWDRGGAVAILKFLEVMFPAPATEVPETPEALNQN